MNIIDKTRLTKINGLSDPYPGSNVEIIKITEVKIKDAFLRKIDSSWYSLEDLIGSASIEDGQQLLYKFKGFLIWEKDLKKHFATETYNSETYFKIKKPGTEISEKVE